MTNDGPTLDTPDACDQLGNTLGYMEYTFAELVALIDRAHGPTEDWQKEALTTDWIAGVLRIRSERSEPRLEPIE